MPYFIREGAAEKGLSSGNHLEIQVGRNGISTSLAAYFMRAIAIDEKALGASHPGLATDLENYASLLRKTKREPEAEELEARAKAIRAKHAQENPVDRGV